MSDSLFFRVVSTASLLLLVLHATACSRHSKIAVAAVQAEQNSELPYELNVLKELNDGRNIYVAGEVLARAELDPKRSIVRLSSWSAGEQIGEAFFPLIESVANAESIEIETAQVNTWRQRLLFSLAVPARNSSDYQLELLWGVEAEPFLKNLGFDRLPQNLQVKNLQMRSYDCDGPDCEPFVLNGELLNVGKQAIDSAKLAVGFVIVDSTAPLDLSGAVPENEEIIEVQGMHLGPGESRAIRLAISSAAEISVEQRAQLKPIVRVISYGS